jgi:hypothetical protein
MAKQEEKRRSSPQLRTRTKRKGELPGDAAEQPRRQRVTVQLSGPVVERLRDAVYWTPGMTMAGFIESCISRIVDELEENRGKRFPKREGQLSPGRPAK